MFCCCLSADNYIGWCHGSRSRKAAFPKVVIPMHYKTPALKSPELETADRFLREIGVTTAVPQPKLAVT